MIHYHFYVETFKV